MEILSLLKSLGFSISSLPFYFNIMPSYLRLTRRMREEFDLAEVVAGGQELAVAASGAIVHVSPVCALRPDTYRLERYHAGVCRPVDVSQQRGLRNLTTHAGVPCDFIKKKEKEKNNYKCRVL